MKNLFIMNIFKFVYMNILLQGAYSLTFCACVSLPAIRSTAKKYSDCRAPIDLKICFTSNGTYLTVAPLQCTYSKWLQVTPPVIIASVAVGGSVQVEFRINL